MQRLLTTAAALMLGLAAAAQPTDTTRYAFPVLGVPNRYAANFGEIRPAHFHAGVDVKTEGVEGKKLVAVADGYIARASVAAYGYGRAVYVTLADGSTAVYGHLSRFRLDVDSCVQAERYARQANEVDLTFAPDRFPVRKGELVGYSGNSGSSMGPHLHFELREAGTDRRLNTVRTGMFRPDDRIPPLIQRLHYVACDTVNGVCLRAAPVSYEVVREAEGRYRLAGRETVPFGRGYFVIEVSDRRNGVGNTFGIWRLRGSIDDTPFFEYVMDGFAAGESRYSDAVSWYARQRRARSEVLRMARLTQTPDAFYPVWDPGALVCDPARPNRICIEVEDDCGNVSTLRFALEAMPEEARFVAPEIGRKEILRWNRDNRVAAGWQLTALIPAGALYEDVRCTPEILPQPLPSASGVAVLSPAVKVLDSEVPLFREMTVEMEADVPRRQRLQATLASYDPRSRKLSYAGGCYTGQTVRARTRTTGWLVAVADTLPPAVRPQFADRADLTRAGALRFTATDNFAGVVSATLRIDGRWVPCDRLPMRSLFYHAFDTPPERRMHRVRFAVTDAVGNTTVWEGEFYR